MSGNSDDRRGRWVYQNLRWHYLPGEDPGDAAVAGPSPEPALSSLVDTRRLTDAVARWTAVSGLPALVCSVEEGTPPWLLFPRDRKSTLDGDPPFRCTLDGVEIQDDLRAAAVACVDARRLLTPRESETPGALAIPVLLARGGAERVRAVVVALLPERAGHELSCSIRGGAALRAGLYPAEDDDSWPDRRAALESQLIAAVDGYGAWLAQILDLRQELSRLRTQNRSLMVRVESAERWLVDSCSAPERSGQRGSEEEATAGDTPDGAPAK